MNVAPDRRPRVAPSGEQIEIAHGDQRAVIVEVGGGLRTYSAGSREILDGYGVDEMCASGRGQVLIPWPNRVRDGRYEFLGRPLQLPLTEPETGNAIHGLVRWAPWTCSEREPSRVLVTHLLRPQPGYPFWLDLRVEYLLSEEGLRVETTATNVGTEPCPFGSGAHPYLTVGTDSINSAILRVPASTMLRSDGRGIPIGTTPVEGSGYDFFRPRPIARTQLDEAFTHLVRDEDGLARVTLKSPDNGNGVTLWVDEGYPYLMLFTGDPLPDVNRRSLAVEPMTCPPNAFQSGDSLIRLAPGESTTSAWGITPSSSE